MGPQWPTGGQAGSRPAGTAGGDNQKGPQKRDAAGGKQCANAHCNPAGKHLQSAGGPLKRTSGGGQAPPSNAIGQDMEIENHLRQDGCKQKGML